MRKQILLILTVILALAFALRVYRLSEVPPSLGWDEASIGYDAWAITIDGKDQWGQSFPFIFKSFGEYKYPFHIYATALSMVLFGQSDFAVRFPSALLGVLNILILFLLVKRLTKNDLTAIIAAALLAISPWHLQFSRVNWETNFALFFFLLGLLQFSFRDNRKPWFLISSFAFFGLDLYTYNAAKVFVPLFVIFLSVIYFRDLLTQKVTALTALLVFALFFLFILISPELSGRVRFSQVSFDEQQVRGTQIYEVTKNRQLGKLQLFVGNYLSHFSPRFLFISGDKNPRHSIQSFGQLYWFDILLIPLGLLVLLRNGENYNKLLFIWFFLALLPGSVVKEAPHASRAMFALGGWQIISAVGLTFLLNTGKHIAHRTTLLALSVALFAVFYLFYARSYFTVYPVLYSQEWQYGYKELFLGYRSQFQRYDTVLVSDTYAQPYIFALYYLKYNPGQFREEAEYNPVDNWGFSTVARFGNFKFMSINADNLPKGKILIFASPQEKLEGVEEKDVIRHLDKSVAFYVYEYEK